MRIRWSEADMTAMLDERVRAAGDRLGTELSGVRSILPAANKAKGDALQYILPANSHAPTGRYRVLQRVSEGRHCQSAHHMGTDYAAEDGYSRNRLLRCAMNGSPRIRGLTEYSRASRSVRRSCRSSSWLNA